MLARYALAEITDEAELEALESHLMECSECRRRAVAVDLIGSSAGEESAVVLHIAADGDAGPVALCGADSPHVISRGLLSGLDASVVCAYCRSAVQGGDGPQYRN